MKARRSEQDTELMDAVDLIIVGIRSGQTPITAIESAVTFCSSSVREGLEQVVHRFHRGSPLAEALVALPQLLGPAAGEFADALAIAERAGQPIVPVLDQLARDTRDRRRRVTAERVRSLPVSLTFPIVVCTLPSFVLLAIAPVILGAITSLGDALP